MSEMDSRIIHLDAAQVQSILPHEYPALFIDCATVTVNSERKNGNITAKYTIDPTYPILPGHFPGNPIFRGVDTLESMAQACAILGLHIFPAPGNIPHFEGARDVKFIHKAKPGDELTLSAEFRYHSDESNRRLKKMVCVFEASAHKKSKLIATATVLGAIASLTSIESRQREDLICPL